MVWTTEESLPMRKFSLTIRWDYRISLFWKKRCFNLFRLISPTLLRMKSTSRRRSVWRRTSRLSGIIPCQQSSSFNWPWSGSWSKRDVLLGDPKSHRRHIKLKSSLSSSSFLSLPSLFLSLFSLLIRISVDDDVFFNIVTVGRAFSLMNMHPIDLRDRAAGVHATRNTYIFREKKRERREKRETFLANRYTNWQKKREEKKKKEISCVSIKFKSIISRGSRHE